MFKTFRVGTVYGIPVRLDVTFLLILPVFAAIIGGRIERVVPILNDTVGTAIDPAALTVGVWPYLLGFVAAVALFACVTLHELGHSFVAVSYGYEIESITLWLLGGIAKPAERPSEWVHELWIAVAGPAVNIVIAGGCLLALAVTPPADVVVFLLTYLGILNVGLAVFNMIPAFPLDGGRVLRALLARSRSDLRATRQAAAVGKAFALLLAILGVVTIDPILLAVALFVYVAATSESRQMLLDAVLEGVSVQEVMTPADDLTTVESDLHVSDLLDVMLEEKHTGYPVLEEGQFVGIVTLDDVQSTDREDAVVADVMTPAGELRTVADSTEVMDGFRALLRNDIGRLPVIENGELNGIITRTDLMRSFRIAMEQDRFENIDRSVRSEIG
jgi:Zn-dependent protease